jgi:putative ATPase subunit of terminase (gpP-like)
MKKKAIITPETKHQAFKYYCMGLTSKEIAKLLDCSYRTIQNFMSAENWKEKRQRLKK